jgi:hypothetical protein
LNSSKDFELVNMHLEASVTEHMQLGSDRKMKAKPSVLEADQLCGNAGTEECLGGVGKGSE